MNQYIENLINNNRIDYLPRAGMIKPAFEYILQHDRSFPYVLEDYDRINATRKYDPSRGTVSKEWNSFCEDIDEWLNKNFIMYYLDITPEEYMGSRKEVVLCYKRPEDGVERVDFNNEPELELYR